MPGLNLHVALSEALEVRGGPLREVEIWAILCQAAETLQDLFLTGEYMGNDGPCFAITPDTLMLCGNGRVQISESSFDMVVDKSLVPAEYSDAVANFSEAAVEKMYVFALGMTVYMAADFRLAQDEDLHLSRGLDALLSVMCEENPAARSTLAHVLQACAEYGKRSPHKLPHSHYIINLYKLVLGSDTQRRILSFCRHHLAKILDDWFQLGSDRYARARYRRQKRSTSHSRSRSRSRSRSQTKDQATEEHGFRSYQRERPLPVGRDQHDPASRPHSALSNRGRLRDRPAYPHVYNADSLSADPKGPHNRKVLSELQPGPGYYPASLSLGPGAFEKSPMKGVGLDHVDVRSMDTKDPSVQEALRRTYDRLKERHRKLQALRHGLDMDDLDHTDMASLRSEITDFGERKSMISANSFTQGVLQPDLMSQFGSQAALQMSRGGPGMDSRMDEEAEWLRRQQEEMLRRQTSPTRPTKPQDYVNPPSRPSSGQRPASSMDDGIHQPRSKSRSASSPRLQSRGRSKSREGRSEQQKPREFTGPEFVHRSGQPEIYLQIPQPKAVSESSLRRVRVILLTGQKLTVLCDPSNTGRQLFDTVVSHLALPEHFFFGITVIQDGEHFFVDNDSKLHKVAPPNWKDGNKGRSHIITFTLFFRVKFYVDNINYLRHPMTRHLYYLQLRRDTLEDRLRMTGDQAVSLAGIALQAEFGDPPGKSSNKSYFMADHYVSPKSLRRLGATHIRDTLPGVHQQNEGLTDTEAEVKYIKEVQGLQDYGIHYYKIYKTKKDMSYPYSVGISVHGILVADYQGNNHHVLHRHPWHGTQKISFSRRRFSILPKCEVQSMKLAKLNYYTESYRKGRYLLQLCSAHHSFQIKMQTRTNLTDMFEQEYPVEAGGEGMYGQFEPDHDTSRVHIYQHHNDDDDDQTRFQEGSFSDDEIQHMDQTYDNVPSSSAQQGLGTRPKTRLNHYEDPADSDSPRSYNSGPHPDHLPPRQAFGDGPSQESAPERRVVVVELEKEPRHGIGITIVGGENMGRLDLGIFVKSVDPHGPAARDGNVHPGDRIIAINGQSLEGLAHHAAVELIRKSPSIVQLVISQTKVGSPVPDADSNSNSSIDQATIDSLGVKGHYLGQQEVMSVMERSVEGHASPESATSPLNILGRQAQQPSPTNSSDLDIEDILPPEALTTNYIHTHMSPVSHMTNPPAAKSSRQASRSHTPKGQSRSQTPKDGHSRSHTPKDGQSRSHTPKEGHSRSHTPKDGQSRSHTPENGNLRTLPASGHHSMQRGGESSDSELEAVLPQGGPGPVAARGKVVPERRTASQGQSGIDPPLLKPGDQYEVILQKKNGSLGLNVTGGINTSVKEGGIYVKSFNMGGPAMESGVIHVGDRVLEVTGVSLIGVTHKQAVETLRSAPHVCRLVMIRGVPPSRRERPPSTPACTSEGTSVVSGQTLSPTMSPYDGMVSPPPVQLARNEQQMEFDYSFVTKAF